VTNRYHLSYMRDGSPRACSCRIRRNHDVDESLPVATPLPLSEPSVTRGGVRFPRVTSPPRSPFGDVIEGVGLRGDLTERAERRVNVRVKNEMDDFQRQVLDELREERRTERLEKERERLRAALVALGDDDYPEHTVVRFTKTFLRRNPAVYTYAAIKADDRWYLTGRVGYRHERGLTWDEFTEWLVAGESVTELTLLVPAHPVTSR
jgi:hypothetical protein